MPVNTVQSRGATTAGWPPDKDPDIARALVDAWSAAYEDLGSDANTMPEGLYLRASDAGSCARALGYRIRRRMMEQALAAHQAECAEVQHVHEADQVGCPVCQEIEENIEGPSNPPTVADQYRMNTGTLVHDELAKHLETAFGEGAKAEVRHVRTDEPGISMHIDAVVTQPRDQLRHYSDGDSIAADVPFVTAVEIKTINGMGYKDTIGVAKKDKPARGPRFNAVVQGSLAAYEVNADRLVILVFALELVGKAIAERNGLDELGTMVAQFSLTPEEYRPVAEREHARMKAALTLVEQGTLPPRSIPDTELPHGNRITNPADGSWQVTDEAGAVVNLGNTWHCAYCWDRDNCLRDGAS